MFLIELTYKVSPEEAARCRDAHIEYIDAAQARGIVIVSGPKTTKTGGLILARFADKAEADIFVHEDPFYKSHVADYRIVEFTPRVGRELLGEPAQ